MSGDREPLVPLVGAQKWTMESAVETYASELTTEAEDYLTGPKRMLDFFTIQDFMLGSVVSPVAGHQRFIGKVSIPYLDKNGKALSVRFRCIQDHNCKENGHSKYDSISGEPTRIFNISAIHQAAVGEPLHITEGEFDCMVLTMLGFKAVAVPGAASWKYHYLSCVRGFSQVYVWGDDDQAGGEFVQKVCKAVASAQPVNIKGGDVTEVFGAGGPSAIRSLIEGSST